MRYTGLVGGGTERVGDKDCVEDLQSKSWVFMLAKSQTEKPTHSITKAKEASEKSCIAPEAWPTRR